MKTKVYIETESKKVKPTGDYDWVYWSQRITSEINAAVWYTYMTDTEWLAYQIENGLLN